MFVGRVSKKQVSAALFAEIDGFSRGKANKMASGDQRFSSQTSGFSRGRPKKSASGDRRFSSQNRRI